MMSDTKCRISGTMLGWGWGGQGWGWGWQGSGPRPGFPPGIPGYPPPYDPWVPSQTKGVGLIICLFLCKNLMSGCSLNSGKKV